MTFGKLIEKAKKDEPTLNWDALLELCSDINIEVKRMNIQAVGLATLDMIIISPDALRQLGPEFLYVIILHEVAHFKRIQKGGIDWLLDKLGTDDYDELLEHMTEEENIADRYATVMYQRLNGVEVSNYISSHLHRGSNAYRQFTEYMLGKIKTLDDYNELVETSVG